MKSFVSSSPVMGSFFTFFWAVLGLVLFLQPAAAQICTFWDSSCVDPLAQTAIPVGFQPLIIRDISLYYAYDANPRGKGHEPMTKTSFWLSFDNPRVDKSAITANRTSEIALRIGNMTGTPGGENNGCDGVWGTDCSNDLRRALKHAIFQLSSTDDYYTRPLETILNQMVSSPPATLDSCPPQLWDVGSIPVEIFAQETIPDQEATLWSSGSMEDPFKTWYIDNMTADQQAEQVAVAILSRAPSYDSEPPDSQDDIQIELACVQAPSGGSSTTSNS